MGVGDSSMPALGELLGMDGGLGLIGGIDVWSDGGMDGRADGWPNPT